MDDVSAPLGGSIRAEEMRSSWDSSDDKLNLPSGGHTTNSFHGRSDPHIACTAVDSERIAANLTGVADGIATPRTVGPQHGNTKHQRRITKAILDVAIKNLLLLLYHFYLSLL